ncbi:transposase [Paenibacillus marinisediminis]
MSKENDKMNPISREPVEVDGVYANEWGREEVLHRGQTFPSDPQLGATEWQLQQYIFDNHHEGRTDERLVPKSKDEDRTNQTDVSKHTDRGDK